MKSKSPLQPQPSLTLTWDQVNAWRLSQHCLTSRLEASAFVDAVSRVVGIQAQLMSAAELALWARVDGLSPQAISTALWQDRTLIKTWAMRGTLHLIAAHELPLYVAARNFYDNRNWPGYFAYYGMNPEQYEALLAAIPEVLGSEPITRQALAAAIANHTGHPGWVDLILGSSWGSPLKPSAFRGDLCFGPSQGQNVTFVNPRKWINGGGQPALDPEQAIQEIVRRYLRAYGPSTPLDFTRWWWGGAGLVQAKQIFKALESELTPVDVEGLPGVALTSTIEPMQNLTPSGSIHLLPLFDAYTLGLGRDSDIEPLLPAAYKKRVYRPQGWITAVVLFNGYIQGVWDYKTKGSRTTVKVELFNTPSTTDLKQLKPGIEAEAERLAAFLNTQVSVEYVS